MFEYSTIEEKIKNFQKLSVKQRLEWWCAAREFINKLPIEIREKQKHLRELQILK